MYFVTSFYCTHFYPFLWVTKNPYSLTGWIEVAAKWNVESFRACSSQRGVHICVGVGNAK